jgi:hypothetical protein
MKQIQEVHVLSWLSINTVHTAWFSQRTAISSPDGVGGLSP